MKSKNCQGGPKGISHSSTATCGACSEETASAHPMKSARVAPVNLSRHMGHWRSWDDAWHMALLCAQRVAAWHKRHQMPSLLADGALAPDALRGGLGLARGFGRHIPFCPNLHIHIHPKKSQFSTSIREAKFQQAFASRALKPHPGHGQEHMRAFCGDSHLPLPQTRILS